MLLVLNSHTHTQSIFDLQSLTCVAFNVCKLNTNCVSDQPYSRAELQVHNNLPHLRASIGETAGLATVQASINETAGLATRKCESCLLATGVVSFFCSAALFSSSSSFSRGTATRKDSPTHLCVCILVKYAMHSGLAKISTSINGKSNHGCYEGSTKSTARATTREN